MNRNHFLFPVFLFIAAVLAVSCGDEHELLKNVTPAQGAKIKFIHASPDAPKVDVFLNDTKLSGVLTVSPAAPASVVYPALFPAVEYSVVAPGTASLSVVAPESGAAAIDVQLPLEDGKYYSIFAVDSAKNISALVLDDRVESIPADGRAYVRFVHVIPNGPDVDLMFSSGATFAAASAQPLANPVAFKGATEYIGVEPGAYSFQLRQAGTTTPAIATLNGQALEINRAYTIYARGFAGGKGTQVPALTRYTNK